MSHNETQKILQSLKREIADSNHGKIITEELNLARRRLPYITVEQHLLVKKPRWPVVWPIEVPQLVL